MPPVESTVGLRMDNADAIHVYEKLGFRLRKTMHLAILTRAD
jgi:hypothetical protein